MKYRLPHQTNTPKQLWSNRKGPKSQSLSHFTLSRSHTLSYTGAEPPHKPHSPNGVACVLEFLDMHTTCSGPTPGGGYCWAPGAGAQHRHKGRGKAEAWGLGAWLVPLTHVALSAACIRPRMTSHLAVASSFVTNSDCLAWAGLAVCCILLLLLSSVCPRSCCCRLSQCLRPYRVGFISW